MSFNDDDNDNDFDEDGSSDEEQNNQDDQGDDQDDGEGDENDNDQDDDDDGGDDDDDDGEGGDGEDTEMQDATQSRHPPDKPTGTLTMPSQDANDPLRLNPTQGQTDDIQGDGSAQETKDQTTVVDRFEVRPEALTAATYDIVPTIAAPQSTSINCVVATPNLKYVLSGGSDGYIRKYNWPDTANGKLMLTVAQRHPFVDSVIKAGVLVSYWENDEGGGKPESISPVYSLAIHKHALWALSGLESGGINLQSVRHAEGSLMHRLKQHTSAVSVLQLSPDERSVLSGSWDKRIFDWDLDTGKVMRKFEGSSSQISTVEVRPESSLPVPKAEEPARFASGTYSSNNDRKPLPNGTANVASTNGNQSAGGGPPSPARSHDSGFSSLFGDDEDKMEPNYDAHGGGDEENDLFGGAITTDMRPGEEPAEDAGGDIDMNDAPTAGQDGAITSEPAVPTSTAEGDTSQNDTKAAISTPQLANGALPNGTPSQPSNPHSSEPILPNPSSTSSSHDPPPQSSSTFLSASFDGSIRIWDRRQSAAVVKMPSRFAPPWCMSAVWSPDGNSFYVGRRNGTVEEFSLHKPLASPTRTFKFPSGSGPVSALKAMPNGRHLVCASYDILRLYDLQYEEQAGKALQTPFLIVPGHRTGVVSALYLDPTCRFMISTAGNRGWEGTSTQVLLGYEIGI